MLPRGYHSRTSLGDPLENPRLGVDRRGVDQSVREHSMFITDEIVRIIAGIGAMSGRNRHFEFFDSFFKIRKVRFNEYLV